MKNDSILYVENMNISFNQKSGKKTIIKNGSFEVKAGEFVLIIGENGSGKSSIFRSLIREDSSCTNNRRLFFQGEEIQTDAKLDFFRKSIGYAKQEDDPDSFFSRNIWNYIYDYVKLSKAFENEKKNVVLREMNNVYNELKCDLYADGDLKNRRLKTCSGGEKRIASILAALSRTKSKLFILDEPINNLDAVHARMLNNYLIKLRKKEDPPGILVITHCHMFQKVDRVYKLNKGELKEIHDYEPKSCYGNCDECSGLYKEEI